jgi:heptose-I-phosphate ethanolaminephosphotransferase
MNMMKQAGYKSYWITNQQTMTKRNTMLTTFSQQMDERYYLNNNREQNARQYDGVVLKPFAQVLKQPEQRKFIVVHLLGTHMNYKYRYPETYARFNDRQGVPAWVSDGDQLSFYNSYDNAVLYNDFVVASLIKELAASGQNGLLVYFSDHGEEVFDTPGLNFKGRNEAAPVSTMYTVPFIIWPSKTWRATHAENYQAALDRPYSTSDFIYTWADLVGLNFDGFDPKKSVINDQFKERTRLIGDPYKKNGLIDFKRIEQAATKTNSK